MRIYLDHNATTPLRDEVVEAMARSLREDFGNPSSTHAEGTQARRRLEEAREQVAALVGAPASHVVFSAGATEANNWVLAALAAGARTSRTKKVVSTATEHPSVLEPLGVLEGAGWQIDRIPVSKDGLIDPAAVIAAAGDAALVSLIWANNETGVVQDMESIADGLRPLGTALHVDATQALGKWPVDLTKVPADFLACSAHKLNGPKGVGALVAREPEKLTPLLRGGPQERRLRGGTENLAGIVGFGAACDLARQELDARIGRYRALRDQLWTLLDASLEGLRRNGGSDSLLPNTLNVEFTGAPSDIMVQALDLEGVAVSAGAACHSGSVEPSHVLAAMGRSPEEARASLRLSVGHGNDETQIARAAEILIEIARRARRANAA